MTTTAYCLHCKKRLSLAEIQALHGDSTALPVFTCLHCQKRVAVVSRGPSTALESYKCPRCKAKATDRWCNATHYLGASNTVTTFACGTEVLDWQLGNPERYEVTPGPNCIVKNLWDHLTEMTDRRHQ